MDFIRGHITLPTETDINLYVDSVLTDAEAVLFTVYDLVSSPPDIIPVGIPNQLAEKISTGHYYARFEIERLAAFGAYKVVFTYAIRDNQNNIQTYALELPFNVVSEVQQPFLQGELDLIEALRMVLRDNNPDAYYRFSPPLKTGEIKGFTRKTGYIWDDRELSVFLSLAGDYMTGFSFGSVVGAYPNWKGYFRPVGIMIAAYFATYAESVRWVGESFDYDIAGVSLKIDRAGPYRDAANGFLDAAVKQAEVLNKSIRFTKGIKMSQAISRGSLLGPSVSHSGLLSFIQGKYKV